LHAFLLHLGDQQLLLSSDSIIKLKLQDQSTFLTSAVTDILTTEQFNLPPPSTAFSFIWWSTVLLYNSCFAVWNFLFVQFAEGKQRTSRILLFKPWKSCQPLFSKPSGTLGRSLPNLGCQLLTKSGYL